MVTILQSLLVTYFSPFFKVQLEVIELKHSVILTQFL